MVSLHMFFLSKQLIFQRKKGRRAAGIQLVMNNICTKMQQSFACAKVESFGLLENNILKWL